jgi:hypothetical protein
MRSRDACVELMILPEAFTEDIQVQPHSNQNARPDVAVELGWITRVSHIFHYSINVWLPLQLQI